MLSCCLASVACVGVCMYHEDERVGVCMYHEDERVVSVGVCGCCGLAATMTMYFGKVKGQWQTGRRAEVDSGATE